MDFSYYKFIIKLNNKSNWVQLDYRLRIFSVRSYEIHIQNNTQNLAMLKRGLNFVQFYVRDCCFVFWLPKANYGPTQCDQ